MFHMTYRCISTSDCLCDWLLIGQYAN